MAQISDDSNLVVPYLTLRKAVGILGMGLPFTLAIGKSVLTGGGLEASLSGYYYTVMRDVYVGSLFAIAVFLLSYRGHDRRDDRAGNLACVFGLGVALLPTAPAVQPTTLQRVLSGCHFAFAAAFLGTLAYFSLKLFRKTGEDGARERRKVYRDWVYTACGVVMLVCMGLIAVLSLIPGDVPVKRLRPVFWLESLAIVAFGVSWLTKGQAILRDRES